LPNLRLVGISDCLPSDIRAFTSNRFLIYAAAGTTVYAFRGLRHVLYRLEAHSSPIVDILAFSDAFLVSYDESGTLIVWNLKTRTQIRREEFPTDTFVVSAMLHPSSSPQIRREEFPIDTFVVSAMLHPSSYKNKLLFGSLQGPLRLWNVVTGKPIYWFKGFDAAVSCLTQSPAKDVCAIGLNDGRIILHNLRYDVSLLYVAQDGGPVTSIEFRSATAGLPSSESLAAAGIQPMVDAEADIFLLAGTAAGSLVSWKLESDGTCRAVNQTEELHLARVVSLFCIPTGGAAGAVVSSGADNSLKVSYFDRPDGGLRMAHVRSGHFLPPNQIAFWTGGSAGGNLLVSAGSDSQLRIFSTFNDRFDKNLGRAYAPGVPSKKKAKTAARSAWLLPGAKAISLCPSRAYDWDSLAVVHNGRREVTTWNFVKATRGKHFLDPAKFHGLGGEALRLHKHTIATALCITHCGNFVVVGYSSGDIIKFNIQSGLEYGAFGDPTGEGICLFMDTHESTIVGVHVNNVNRLLVSVGETGVKFWNFFACKPLGEKMNFLDSAPIRLSKFHADSDVLGLALSSGEIVLVNVLNRQLFRRFPNAASQPCVDLTMSSDGTLLVSAHRGDALIKLWDVVDCKLLDCFRVKKAVTSIAFSPSDDLLATTHVGCLGVYLWDNRATYQRLQLTPLPFDYVPPTEEEATALPTRSLSSVRQLPGDGEEADEDVINLVDFSSDEERQEENEQMDISGEQKVEARSSYLSPDQLQDKLATLSGLPASFFKAFLQLDAIKKRNAEALAVPDETKLELPFFLPVIETTTGMAWIDEADDEEVTELANASNALETARSASKRTKRRKKMSVDEIFESHLDSVLADLPSPGENLTDQICDETMARLKALNPSSLDMEIRLLAPAPDELAAAASAIDFVDKEGPLKRLCSFLALLVNRFKRNLDVDFATACLEGVLRRHGEVIARPSHFLSTTKSPDFDETVVLETMSNQQQTGTENLAFALVEEALKAKRSSQTMLFSQITRSIALVDFIRNASCTLQIKELANRLVDLPVAVDDAYVENHRSELRRPDPITSTTTTSTATTAAVTTTTTNDGASVLSYPHCGRTFASRIGLAFPEKQIEVSTNVANYSSAWELVNIGFSGVVVFDKERHSWVPTRAAQAMIVKFISISRWAKIYPRCSAGVHK
uniref:Utp21 domain-containing protein n=1 Tax=Schistocephalus solidus TaxID=70667 RepID=A0A183SPV9_SCHSO